MALKEAYDIAERYQCLTRQFGAGYPADAQYARECLDAGINEEEILQRLTKLSPFIDEKQIFHRCTLAAAKVQREIVAPKLIESTA